MRPLEDKVAGVVAAVYVLKEAAVQLVRRCIGGSTKEVELTAGCRQKWPAEVPRSLPRRARR